MKKTKNKKWDAREKLEVVKSMKSVTEPDSGREFIVGFANEVGLTREWKSKGVMHGESGESTWENMWYEREKESQR